MHMGKHVELTAPDGHRLDAYVAEPAGKPRASLVVVQEIFGVNAHIRSVADRFAAEGYAAVAPALFDRFERGVELGYEGADRDKAMTFPPRLNMGWHLQDTATAAEYARATFGTKVGVVGYCLGGTIAWLSAAELPIDAAVGYYGGFIPKLLDKQPRVPILLHFGALDQHIPASEVEKIREAHPDVPVYLYEGAGHGFNCDARAGFHPEAAKQAGERTLAFLAQHLEGDGA
jgi:carboxymethylenebutenolidase